MWLDMVGGWSGVYKENVSLDRRMIGDLIRTVTIRYFVTFVTDDFKRGSVRFDATDAQNIGECILF